MVCPDRVEFACLFRLSSFWTKENILRNPLTSRKSCHHFKFDLRIQRCSSFSLHFPIILSGSDDIGRKMIAIKVWCCFRKKLREESKIMVRSIRLLLSGTVSLLPSRQSGKTVTLSRRWNDPATKQNLFEKSFTVISIYPSDFKSSSNNSQYWYCGHGRVRMGTKLGKDLCLNHFRK